VQVLGGHEEQARLDLPRAAWDYSETTKHLNDGPRQKI